MTQALDKVIAEISTLSADEQDRIAEWLTAELIAEKGWAYRFNQSQDMLTSLAAEAVADVAAGRTTEIDPDKM